MRETQGEKVSALVLFEQTVDMSAVASVSATQLHEKAAKGLGVGIMNHHENKKENWTACSKVQQVHRDDQSLLPLLVHSFVACGRTRRPHAPASKHRNP